MSKNQSNNKWFSKILKLCLICGLCVSFYYVGLSKRQDNSDIIKAKDAPTKPNGIGAIGEAFIES